MKSILNRTTGSIAGRFIVSTVEAVDFFTDEAEVDYLVDFSQQMIAGDQFLNTHKLQ